jgi:hypothetical protein
VIGHYIKLTGVRLAVAGKATANGALHKDMKGSVVAS